MLEQFLQKSVKEGKFVEAELAKQRIAQLKNVQDKKMVENVKSKQKQEKESLENTQKEELNKFNVEKDKQLYELSSKFQNEQKALEARHEREINDLISQFRAVSAGEPLKPSADLIELNRRLEFYVKQQE